MNLSDKPCYPSIGLELAETLPNNIEVRHAGLAFRERLIIALASNPRVEIDRMDLLAFNADVLIAQADTIIKEMESK